jgi:hypothetical protein
VNPQTKSAPDSKKMGLKCKRVLAAFWARIRGVFKSTRCKYKVTGTGYDSQNYARNFDDGTWREDEDLLRVRLIHEFRFQDEDV